MSSERRQPPDRRRTDLRPPTAGRTARTDATIVHLREVLGEVTYDALTRTGRAMNTTAIVNYAYAHIEQVRSTLPQPETIDGTVPAGAPEASPPK